MAAASVAGGPPTVDGYSDLRVIGHGASSTVYRARQDNYDRQVALKVLNVDVSDRRAQRRFTRERALNGRLSHHPNVVTVLDSGFVDGRYPFLTMELFEQGSLTDRIESRGPFELALALQIGVRVAGALETAHRLGVLHRDVKPQNILLSRYGEPALADFGIAAILEMEASFTAGLTPVHAAPEILEGADPSAQADVYALGSTLFTVLAGVAPFAGPPGEGMLAQLLRITTSDLPALPRSDVPDAVVELLRWATAKRPDERAPSAVALGIALQDLQRDLGQPVTTLPVEAAGDLPATAESSPAPPVPPPVATTVGEATIDARVVAEPPIAAVAWSPPAGRAPIADETVGAPVIDTPTVLGRHLAPDPTVAPRPRRRRLVVAAAVLVPLAVAVGVGAAVLGGDDDDPVTAPTPPPSIDATVDPTTSPTGATGPTTTVDLAAFAPTDLAASVDTGAVVLTWTDHTDGAVPQLVQTHVAGAGRAALSAVPTGAEIHTVADLDPSTPACFRVQAVLSMAEDQAVTADSEWTCINGATPVTANTSAPPTT